MQGLSVLQFFSFLPRNQNVRSANMWRKEVRRRKRQIPRSLDAEERFHQGDWCMSHVKVDPSSLSNFKTSNLKSKNEWTNGRQKNSLREVGQRR